MQRPPQALYTYLIDYNPVTCNITYCCSQLASAYLMRGNHPIYSTFIIFSITFFLSVMASAFMGQGNVKWRGRRQITAFRAPVVRGQSRISQGAERSANGPTGTSYAAHGASYENMEVNIGDLSKSQSTPHRGSTSFA